MKMRKASHAVTVKAPSQRVRSILDHDQIMEILGMLQQKMLGSAALNGGFDTLLNKIDKIEEGQVHTGGKVDSIHDAIYHPDDGLFARVKDVEHFKEKIDHVERLGDAVVKLQQWRDCEEKSDQKALKKTEENEKQLEIQKSQIKDLVDFQTRSTTLMKWILATVGGSMVTGLVKLVYDFAQSHIMIH